ncbi:MAG TPA: hypothetical protein VLG16_03320 [Candidatus Saccharimonadales bacterium]|nr:hypothetical protein [Candidatus Saccharimonadales bacterium]
MIRYRFKKVPANLGLIKHTKSERITPNDIYEYAKSFRGVYTRSMPLLKKITDPKWANQHEIKQLYGKAQSLAVQIALSNELLLKAILLASTGNFEKEHNLKKLVESLDNRYIAIIKAHLEDNGLKDGHLNKVLDMSAQTFINARYGFESTDYFLDFRTLQLLNEALDDIFNNYVPDWTALTKAEQESKEKLKQEMDLLFDEDYQQEQAKELRAWRKIFKS